MHLRSFALVLVVIMLVVIGPVIMVGCAGPHALPVAPTPIPTLLPATLPAAPVAAVKAPTAAPAPTGAQPTTPQPTTAAPAPAARPADQTGPGKDVFSTTCSACHNLTADKKVGPGLAKLFAKANLPNGKPLNDDNLKEWIHNGSGAMPPVPSLTDEQLNQLLAYLKEATK